MLTKEEMVQFREEMRSAIREEVPTMIRAEIREEMKDVVRREELEKMFIEHGRRITEDVVQIVGDMIDDNIAPQIQELRNDIASIKRGHWQLA